MLALSTIGLWITTGRSVSIARRALTELERPLIVVSVADPGMLVNEVFNFDFAQPSVQWEVANYGRSPVILVDRILRFVADTNPSPNAVDSRVAKGSFFPDGCVVIEGKSIYETHNLFLEIDNYEDVYGTKAVNGPYRVWCFGYVRYKDTIGGVYVNGFCLIFDAVGKRFVRMGPPTHNYTYVEKEPGTSSDE